MEEMSKNDNVLGLGPLYSPPTKKKSKKIYLRFERDISNLSNFVFSVWHVPHNA